MDTKKSYKPHTYEKKDKASRDRRPYPKKDNRPKPVPATEEQSEHSIHGDYENGAVVGNGVYTSYALGLKAFGEVKNEEAQMILKGKEFGGPLNQWSTVGYKFTHGGVILYPERCVKIISTATFGEEVAE